MVLKLNNKHLTKSTKRSCAPVGAYPFKATLAAKEQNFMNRVEIEKLLLWLVPIALVAALANQALSQIVAETIGQIGTTVTIPVEEMSWIDRNFTMGEKITYLNILKLLPMLLVRVVISVWLFIQAQKSGGRSWLWCLSGLLLQYWALAIFFFAHLLEGKSNESEVSSS